MARKIEVQIVGDASSLQRAFSTAQTSGRNFGRNFAAGIAAAGVAVAGTGVLITKAVKQASDLNEEINKSTVVFGQASGDVLAWSETTATAIGIARAKALEAAGAFGAMLETAGLNEKAAAGMSKRLVQLAADMASFNNIDPEEALLKLRSGLAGEAEPLRRVGVLLSEARVQQEAYAAGIAKQGAKLTEAQKVQARYNLILQDTQRQQGDFARTSTGLANSTRIIKAVFQDLGAQLGSKFLPVVAKGATGLAALLQRIEKADGAKAKISVVLTGVQNLGEGLYRQVRGQISAIDWPSAVSGMQRGLLSAIGRIGQQLGDVDWRQVGTTVGRSLVAGLEGTTAFLRSVDWSGVGEQIVRGLSDFLVGVDWKKLAVVTIRGIGAAFAAYADLLRGIGSALASAIYNGLRNGFESLVTKLEVQILKLIRGLLSKLDFKVLGRSVIPGLGSLKDHINSRLREIELQADSTGRALSAALQKPTAPAARKPTAEVQKQAAVATQQKADIRKTNQAVPATAVKKETAAEKAKRLYDTLVDRLQVSLDRAALTPTMSDDLRLLRQIISASNARLKVSKSDLDAERNITAAMSQQKQIAQQRGQALLASAAARQFKALGLGPTGQQQIPGVAALKRQLATLDKAIEGTFLDDKKTASVLAKVRRVLSGGLGKVGADVRRSIQEILADMNSQLKDDRSGPLTKTTALDANKILSGVGLSASEVKSLRARLSQLNSAGQARAGVRVPPVSVTVQAPPVYLDGRAISRNTSKHQNRNRRLNPPPRRGPNAGLGFIT